MINTNEIIDDLATSAIAALHQMSHDAPVYVQSLYNIGDVVDAYPDGCERYADAQTVGDLLDSLYYECGGYWDKANLGKINGLTIIGVSDDMAYTESGYELIVTLYGVDDNAIERANLGDLADYYRD